MQASKPRQSLLRKPTVQTLLASLVCILLGLLVGYIALLIINPSGATEAIVGVIKNLWAYSKPEKQLKNLGVTPIEALGATFDPTVHNAVMHLEDPEKGEQEIVQEFQKGFKMGERVIRFSMVQVAN